MKSYSALTPMKTRPTQTPKKVMGNSFMPLDSLIYTGLDTPIYPHQPLTIVVVSP